MDYKEYCVDCYDAELYELMNPSDPKKKKLKETAARKGAIKQAFYKCIAEYPDVEPSLIWKELEIHHMFVKSGIEDLDLVESVISASQSWKKSSGHAFEEFIKEKSEDSEIFGDIQFVLQKDLNKMIKNKEISNISEDITWFKNKIKGSVFDLYAIATDEKKKVCFGCIQSKTSIRDRNTRDREPSISAMDNFFWSICIVLDGDYLKNEKFVNMVNGGSSEFVINGWHTMYVLSNCVFTPSEDVKNRIVKTDCTMQIIADHAKLAYEMWKEKRHLFGREWYPEEDAD